MLIAGLASDSQSWQPLVAELSRRYLVIVADNRGVGRTTPQDAATSIQAIADDCMTLVSHLGLSSVHVLGHSMGGFVALDCALRYPAHVASLVLAATSTFNSARNNALFRDWACNLKSGMDVELWYRNMFYWIFSRRFFDNSDAVNKAVQCAVEYPYPQRSIAFERQVNAIEEFNCRDGLSGITAPTLIMCGKEDLLFPPEESTRALQAIPASRVALIEGAAHAIHTEQPAACAACIARFLT